MKNELIILLAIALFLVSGCDFGIGQNQSDDDETLDRLKELSDFNNWPGKNGIIRAGVILNADRLPCLQGSTEVVKLKLPDVHETDGKLRVVYRYNWQFSSNDLLDASIVITESCEDAHQYLMERRFYSSLPFELRVPKRDEVPLIGDISFFEGWEFIFNNIVGRLIFEGKFVEKKNDFLMQLKSLFNSSPTAKTCDAFKPIITKFTIASNPVKRGSLTKLFIEVKDPNKSEIVFVWRMTAGAVEQDKISNCYYHADPDNGGTQVLILYAVNQLGFAAKAEIEIIVE